MHKIFQKNRGKAIGGHHKENVNKGFRENVALRCKNRGFPHTSNS